jgi:hypothetical protein
MLTGSILIHVIHMKVVRLPEGRGSSPDEVFEFFFQFAKFFQLHCGVFLASNINEHQKIFLEVKSGRRVRLTTNRHL